LASIILLRVLILFNQSQIRHIITNRKGNFHISLWDMWRYLQTVKPGFNSRQSQRLFSDTLKIPPFPLSNRYGGCHFLVPSLRMRRAVPPFPVHLNGKTFNYKQPINCRLVYISGTIQHYDRCLKMSDIHYNAEWFHLIWQFIMFLVFLQSYAGDDWQNDCNMLVINSMW
jgi:hypothetical protein